MKIGVLTHNYPRFAGDYAGRFVAELAAELARQGHDVCVLTPWDPACTEPCGPPGARQGVRVEHYRYAPRTAWHRLAMGRDPAGRREKYLLVPAVLAAGAHAAVRWARREQPEVLHAHWLLPSGFAGAFAARRLQLPLVISIPGSDTALREHDDPALHQLALFAVRQASLITASSESVRAQALARLQAPADKLDLITCGVDPNALRPDCTGTAELRAELGIPADALVVLAVGEMTPNKGFDVLLSALARLPAAGDRGPSGRPFPAVYGVLVGEGPRASEWRGLGQALGIADRLRWAAHVPADRLAVYYNMADLAVAPSLTQPVGGHSAVLLEAMSCGKPVVGSAAAGSASAIWPNLNGYVVPEADEAALAQAIAALAGDPALRTRMGAASRRLIETELGWPTLAACYLAHFQRLTRPA